MAPCFVQLRQKAGIRSGSRAIGPNINDQCRQRCVGAVMSATGAVKGGHFVADAPSTCLDTVPLTNQQKSQLAMVGW